MSANSALTNQYMSSAHRQLWANRLNKIQSLAHKSKVISYFINIDISVISYLMSVKSKLVLDTYTLGKLITQSLTKFNILKAIFKFGILAC